MGTDAKTLFDGELPLAEAEEGNVGVIVQAAPLGFCQETKGAVQVSSYAEAADFSIWVGGAEGRDVE